MSSNFNVIDENIFLASKDSLNIIYTPIHTHTRVCERARTHYKLLYNIWTADKSVHKYFAQVNRACEEKV